MNPRLSLLVLPLLALTACLLALTACGGSRRESPVEIRGADNPVGERWNASLGTPADLVGAVQVQGTAWMGRGSKDNEQTRVEVSISNAIPGAIHPWHVHRGQCGADEGILEPADAYKPLRVNREGRATSQATLPMAMPTSGQFYVNVHASPTNLGTIVACGNLAPPTR